MPEVNEKIFLALGNALYLLAFAYALVGLLRERRYGQVPFSSLLALGFILQTVGLYLRGLEDQAFPVLNFFEVMQVIGWGAIILDFILRPTFRLWLLGFFLSGLAGLIGLVSFLNSNWDILEQSGTNRNPWDEFHAALSVFGYAFFGVLAVVSLMYLMQHYGLKKKKVGGVFALLPAIRRLEEASTRLLWIGVLLFSVGVGIGVLNYFTSAATVSLLKLGIAVAVWGAYLAVFLMRRSQKLVGVPFAWACIILFTGAMASLQPLTVTGDQPAKTEVQDHAGE